MPTKFGSRLQHAWNAFFNKDPTYSNIGFGSASYFRPDRYNMSPSNKRSIVAAIYNKIAVDASMIKIEHVLTDQNGRYQKTVDSGLNDCLKVKANIDQSGKDLIRDIIISMFDEGCAALVITQATANPAIESSYDIGAIRVAKIVQWYPQHVKVDIYNDVTGKHIEQIYPKHAVAIIENPFYMIMNEPNSIMQQLIRKLNLLNYIESRSNYGKIDLIIQLPYLVRSPKKKALAEQRRKEVEDQLANSQYGIAYTDGTERITQLNRPVENKIWEEVKDLTSMLYNQLGLTQSVIDGTASEQAMINYFNSTIDPTLAAIADGIQKSWFTKTARTKGHCIRYFRDAFRLVPARDLAEIADKLTRNEIVSSNEVRAEIGYKPSDDPRADELINSNMNRDTGDMPVSHAPDLGDTEET